MPVENVRMLIKTHHRVKGNNALVHLSAICGDATATLFGKLKLTKGVRDWISRGLEPQKNIWKSVEKVFESCHPDC